MSDETESEIEWPLDRVKRLLAAATPGPWRVKPTPSGMVSIEPGIGWAVPGFHGEAAALANAELIAEAPLLLAWLVRTIEAEPSDWDWVRIDVAPWSAAAAVSETTKDGNPSG